MNQLNLSKKQLIVDLHLCLQGEGKFAGIPHLLIRFSGCNMNCQFKDSICDTPYASWVPEQAKHSFGELIEIIKKNPQITHAFITGGEPTLNENLLKDTVSILNDYSYFIAIETNGTIFRDIEDIHFVTISPKLSNSVPRIGSTIMIGEKEYKVDSTMRDKQEKTRKNYDSMKKWYDNFPTQFKFVISNGSEIEEILEIQKIVGISNHDIFLMPEGITNDQLQEKRELLFDMCIKYGFNYSDRLHIITYGNKRLA